MTGRYSNGKIYKLVNNVDDQIYVGSTCLPFAKRFYWQKARAKRNLERNVYKHFNAIGWENVKIILIETYPCNSKAELEKRERYWFDKFKPSLNSNVPFKVMPEYFQAEKKATAHKNLLMCKIDGFLAYHRIISENFKNE